MNRTRLAVAAFFVVAVTSIAAPAPAEFQVVVNPQQRIAEISRADLAAVFMKRPPQAEEAKALVAVDQRAAQPVRDLFCKAILGRSASGVVNQWQQAIFSGRDVPPLELSSDEAVATYVRDHPNAIGYVSAAANPAGVKVIGVRM